MTRGRSVRLYEGEIVCARVCTSVVVCCKWGVGDSAHEWNVWCFVMLVVTADRNMMRTSVHAEARRGPPLSTDPPLMELTNSNCAATL